MAHILFERLLPVLNGIPEYAEQEPATQGCEDVEVFSLFLATAMDLITAYLFGLSNSTNFIDQETYRRDWQEMYLARANYPFWTQEVPTLTSFCKQWFPWLRLYPKWVDESNSKLSDWNWSLCDKTNKARINNGVSTNQEGVDHVDESVVYNALHAGIDREFRVNGERSILYNTSILHRDRAIASELMDHSLAGQETAGIALTYATWHVSKSPSLQEQLRAEILTLEPSLKVDDLRQRVRGREVTENISGSPILPDPKAVDSLPLLHAVVMETLRLYAPIPGPQPRQTPKEGCYIGEHYIPGNVRIAALAYTLHRDTEVFPRPEQWKPGRWLKQASSGDKKRELRQDEVQLREINKRFWAFGSGGRMCVGSNFAMNEMKFILAAIYANFQTTVVDDGGIEQEDAYTARPVGERLVIRFHKL
ncbi:hypothetical protein NW762_004236 [Fusarium torreyae]|uniref:Cytochrome P450 monooxygenase n=1 Tax=Fusarium torreyae TaxID=1237075 RepID=A0A9W8VGP4_9HYPO|nr:hypothetical protein NW762_004236 [Fusarium torreyae]